MSHLEANLGVLEARFPGITRDLRSQNRQTGVTLTVEPSRGVPGGESPWTARVGTLRLYSAFDPLKDAARSLPEIDPQADFAVIAGFGLGYHGELVTQRYPDLPLLVCDPDAGAFLAALEARDLGSFLANPLVSFLVGGSPRSAAGYLETFVCRRIAYLPLRPLFEVHRSWFLDLERTLNDFQAKSRVNDQTLARFYRLWLRNHTKNLEQTGVLAPVAALKGIAAGLPGVICAAGPSLGSSLEWISQNRDHLVLIVVDTAWNAVRLAGLVPDFLVFMDGQYWNSRHVDGQVPPQTRVVAELVSHPRALRCAPGRTYVSHSSVPFLKDWEEKNLGNLGTLKSGGSVSTCAWELALLLGVNPVAFAGLDLGFPQNQTHVRGSQFEESFHRSSRRLVPAETLGFRLLSDPTLHPYPSVGGQQVLSDARMDIYRDWLELAFSDHPEVRVHNLSPNGSLVRGMVPGFPPNPGKPITLGRVGAPALKLSRSAVSVPDPHGLDEVCRFLAQAQVSGDWVKADWKAQLGRYSQKAREIWGPATWAILVRQAENSFERFPSARSLGRLVSAWSLVRDVASCWFKFQKSKTWGQDFSAPADRNNER